MDIGTAGQDVWILAAEFKPPSSEIHVAEKQNIHERGRQKNSERVVGAIQLAADSSPLVARETVPVFSSGRPPVKSQVLAVIIAKA